MTHQSQLLPDQPSPDQAARDAERAEYLERLREKLKDPKFRAIKGFPHGRDEDILARHKTDRHGKSAMMYAMCHAVDLPVDVLMSRDRQLGSIDRSACTIDQFTDFIIVLEGDPKRYYVPTTQPCPPGELPKGLRGLPALATKPDLKEPVREVTMEAMSRSSGRFGPSNSAPWYARSSAVSPSSA